MNSAVSSEPEEWNRMINEEYAPSYVVRIGSRIIPELESGISYHIGPYSSPLVKSALPAGKSIDDYKQEVYGFDLTFTRGWTTVSSEVFIDEWYVPNVKDNPFDYSYYIELKQKLMPGLFAALRYNSIIFNELRKSYGIREKWDYDVERIQAGAGISINRQLLLIVDYSVTTTHGPYEPKDNLASIQLRYNM